MATHHGIQKIAAEATHYRHAWRYYGLSIHAYAYYPDGREATTTAICGVNSRHCDPSPKREACRDPTCRTCARIVREKNLQPLNFPQP